MNPRAKGKVSCPEAHRGAVWHIDEGLHPIEHATCFAGSERYTVIDTVMIMAGGIPRVAIHFPMTDQPCVDWVRGDGGARKMNGEEYGYQSDEARLHNGNTSFSRQAKISFTTRP